MTTAIVTVEDGLIVSADTNYQGFTYNPKTNTCLPTNSRAVKKWYALKGVFPGLVKDRTVLDIGASTGFLCFMALEFGATWVIGIEREQKRHRTLRYALAEIIIPKLSWQRASFPKETQHLKADVTIVMSLVHHLFPRMSLEEILHEIAGLTQVAALVEFPMQGDRQVQKKGWVPKHPEYNHARFLELAKAEFGKVTIVGPGHHDTRIVHLLEK